MTGKKVNRLIVPNVYTANGVEPVTSVNNTLPVNGNVTIPIPTVPTNVSAFTNDAGYLTSATLDEYATQSWVQQQGYLTSVPSQYITDTELSITLADYVTSTNLTTILDDYATKQWVTNQGYTTNAGTVTSVNNIQPSANGNVTLIIPDTSNLANKDLSNLSSAGKSKFQVPLVSGTNIKTINNQSLLGSGNIDIQGGGAVDQTFDGTSANAQSGVAIEGELSTNYQPKLVSGTNIKTINHTSLLGSGNINVLRNTATGSNSITILGTATSNNEAINIGYGSNASTYATALGRQATASSNATAIGYRAIASGYYSTALGHGTSASGKYAIQIGSGTNSTASTLQIGFGTSNNYTLLDGTTGLIPDARISSNIARTSDIPDVSNFVTNSSLATTLSSYATQAWVGQQGYITDVINALGFTPADRELENITSMGSLISGEFDNVYTALDAKANTDLSNLSATGKKVLYSKPTISRIAIVAGASQHGDIRTYSLANYLPDDGLDYLVQISCKATTASTSGAFMNCNLTSSLQTNGVQFCSARTRSNSFVEATGCGWMLIGSDRKLYHNGSDSNNYKGTYDIQAMAYIRVGSNS